MDTLRIRGNVILFIMGLCFMVYIFRLLSIQVLSQEYGERANRTVIQTRPIIPPRGNIYNRHGEIYVSNRPVFNLNVTYSELFIPDTSLLLELTGMELEDLNSRISLARERSRFQEFVVARNIEKETYGVMLERLIDFRGISFSVANKRHYNHSVGGNVLGYINEVAPADIRSSKGRYRMGDLVGRTGIERSQDTILRGKQGNYKVLVNNRQKVVGSYAGGNFDDPAEKGQDIMLGIDTRLQAVGEELMFGKKGSIVAIEPKSGEILAFVSAPTYDPTELTGKKFSENFGRLKRDSLSPLFNRPLRARYPPGSIFKIPLALAALEEGIINSNTYYSCGGGFKRNRGKPGCRFHAPQKLKSAIRVSCNSYFAATYYDFIHSKKFANQYEGYNTWFNYMEDMGIGKKLSLDIPYEIKGLLPTAEYYDGLYRGRWNGMSIISNSIGQGEILMTPVQMAHMTAIVANRGSYVYPHFVRAIRAKAGRDWIRIPHEQNGVNISRNNFELVIEAMESVVNGGTASRAFISDISIAGKTGTVENPHGEDHAVFV
ncbi:MAG: penicillin-binding protein 2, partial [Bacteroidia bacterium]|nr:penicillin-binding protein 2 [Bacteroidia bacterium]